MNNLSLLNFSIFFVVIFSTGARAAVVTFLPKSSACPLVKLQTNTVKNTLFPVIASDAAVWSSKRPLDLRNVSEMVYRVYEDDELFDREELNSIRSSDQSLDPATAIHLALFDDFSDQPVAAIRAVSSIGDVGFLSGSTPSSELRLMPMQMPLYRDFPEIRAQVDAMGPAAEIGRLATINGGPRLSRALLLVTHLLEIMADAPFETTMLAHAITKNTQALYKMLGFKTFAEVERDGKKHYFLASTRSELKEWLHDDFKNLLITRTDRTLVATYEIWKKRYESLNTFQKKNPIPLIYGAHFEILLGRYDLAGARYSTINSLLGQDLESSVLAVKLQSFAAMGSNGLPLYFVDRVRKIAESFDETSSRLTQIKNVSPFNSIDLRVHSVAREIALESGEIHWIESLKISQPIATYAPQVDRLIDATMKRIREDNSHDNLFLWLNVMNWNQMNISKLCYYSRFFRLKAEIARQLGFSSLEQRYRRTEAFLKAKNWYPESDEKQL